MYRFGCGEGALGECVACSNANMDEYYTGPGALTNACPVQSCVLQSACPMGQYRYGCGCGSSQGACVDCTNALPGEYYVEEERGTNRSALINDNCTIAPCDRLARCSIGQYRHGCQGNQVGSCIACTNKATSEYYTSDGGLDGECDVATCDRVQCEPGQYRLGNCGDADTVNMTRANNNFQCLQCPKGWYSADQSSATQCTECQPGSYQDEEGQTLCKPCASGHYCPRGASAELPCLSGSYSSQPGLTHTSNCTTCPAGSACPTGSIMYVACLPGSFSALSGQATCSLCDPGTFQVATGATACERCESGHYCLEGAAAALPCPAGTRTNQALAVMTSVDDCISCEPGAYCPIGSPGALSCSAGTFNNAPQQASCRPCAAGSYQNEEGATACKNCAPGHWCSASEQIPCSLNTFNANRSSHLITDCQRCPPRTSTLDKDAATNPDDCVCGDNYYRAFADHVRRRRGCALHPQGGAGCCTCPVGTACPGGTPLSDLPLKRGYFRLNESSADVRRCPDAGANCTGRNECPSSSSGCYGGPNATQGCMPTLTGVFCRLCESDDHYYVQATPLKAAHCLSCAGVMKRAFTTEGNMVALWIVGAVVLTMITLTLCCARGMPVWLHARRRRLQQLLARVWHKAAREYTVLNKLKIMIGFYQIVTKVERIYDVYLPAEVRALLQFFQVFISLGLEGVPLTCVGAVGFHRELIFWMIVPLITFAVVVLVAYMRAFVLQMSGQRQPVSASSPFERILPIFLRVAFLAYPVVTSIAFEAFSCHVFDDGAGSWLVADVSIKCESSEHSAIKQTAWFAIVAYPIGMLATNAVLLFCSRSAISSKQPTRLSRALGFLHREYKPAVFFWELMEMARRFLLVGLFVIVPYDRGSLMQIGLATLTSMVFFFVQQNAEPFNKRSDNHVALAASFSIIGVFFCCVFLKISTLTELEQINELLSVEQHTTYVFDTLPLTAILIVCVISSLAVSSVLVLFQASEDARRTMHEVHLAKARRLVVINKRGNEVMATVHSIGASLAFHLFLSHTWDQGQDEMRVVKQKLLEMLPDLSIFLDVDDLKEGAGGEYVDKSSVVLVFCTERYLKSRACARELFKALLERKPMITVLEPAAKRGGLTREQITHVLTLETFPSAIPPATRPSHGPSRDGIEAVCEDWSAKWKLDDEVTSWGHTRRPSGAEILKALFEHPPIEWNRFSALQDVTMRLIAERLLVNESFKETFVKGEIGRVQIMLPPPVEERHFHLYCSPHNLGAEQLGLELHELIQSSGAAGSAALLVTSDLKQLRSCDFMLLYLTSATWTSGTTSTQYAEEVVAAVKAGVTLLPVHEFPSALEANEVRRACDFDAFWRDGWTPKHLLVSEFNIYRQIAIALKAGAWRRPGLMQVALKLAEGGLPRQPVKGHPEMQPGSPNESSTRLTESGVVSVRLWSASRLRCGGDGTSLADPYVVTRLGDIELSCRPCEATLDPIWEDALLEFELPRLADASAKRLLLHVRNHDAFRMDDDLGNVSVALSRLADSDLLQFTEELSKQGTLTFSVAWRACEITPQPASSRMSRVSSRHSSGERVSRVSKFLSGRVRPGQQGDDLESTVHCAPLPGAQQLPVPAANGNVHKLRESVHGAYFDTHLDSLDADLGAGAGAGEATHATRRSHKQDIESILRPAIISRVLRPKAAGGRKASVLSGDVEMPPTQWGLARKQRAASRLPPAKQKLPLVLMPLAVPPDPDVEPAACVEARETLSEPSTFLTIVRRNEGGAGASVGSRWRGGRRSSSGLGRRSTNEAVTMPVQV